MIITALILVFLNLCRLLIWPILWLPDVVVDSNFAASIGQVGSYLGVIDPFFPMATFLASWRRF